MSSQYQAILLIAFGGPTTSAEIRPFLARVTRGIAVPPGRLEEVARHYEAVGGKSPLTEITFRQAKALQNLLTDQGTPLPVFVGFRNSSPLFTEALNDMRLNDVTAALGLILSSLQSEASWERYQKNIADARGRLGSRAPEIDYCGGWHDHPLFVATWQEQIAAAYAKIAPDRRCSTPLVFTAHSLPVEMAAASPYAEQLETSARLVAERFGGQRWLIAYQSRSGKPADPWLEPDINDVIRQLAAEGCREVVVAPIGFVCDHVEVLYDLDIEACRLADSVGIHLVRASCPNDHPTFIRMAAEVIRASTNCARDRT